MNPLEAIIGTTDIYLLDQIMKGRYAPDDVVLDAGCGYGRNLHWFLRNGITTYGVDLSVEAVEELRRGYAGSEERFRVAGVEEMPFADEQFDHVISSAVLHFAKSVAHFQRMMAEMVRVLRPGGTIFIRMTTDIGIEDRVRMVGDGVYVIPDGSRRFLLTRGLLAEVLRENGLSFLEPLKVVNVDDVRCMCTLVLRKLPEG